MTRSLINIFCAFLPILCHAQPGAYDIYALKFGERKNYVQLKNEALGDNSGDSTQVFFMYWLLKSDNKTILVDAGFTADAGIDTTAITFTQPDKLLAAIAVKPGEITDIIITHPHWDHIGGIDLYPNAMVWMQEEDYNDFVAKRRDPEASGFNKKDIQKVRDWKAKGSLTLVKGNDQVILPGVTVFTGSKHTAGSQFVMANNGKQNVILASDNCKYYRNITKMLSSPATSDQKAYIRNLKTMKQYLVGNTDFIIPGHDPLVFSKFKTVAKDVVLIKKRDE
jgi:glyoxylase-like metal-dependent hydrolase (beta-lactamase superfamily II)